MQPAIVVGATNRNWIARMSRRVSRVVVTGALALGIALAPAVSRAAEDYGRKATTAFGLGRYAEAGENFEKAYEQDPIPSLLYDAAQSYRLAGNKERALNLYQNYLRLYGRDKRADIEARIDELKKAIEKDKAAQAKTAAAAPAAPAKAPEHAPVQPIEPVSSRPAGEVPTAAPPAVEPAAVVSAQPAPSERDEGSIVTRPWFWVVVGGVVAAGVVGAVLLAGGAKDPKANVAVNGN
jgi:tetratricopeptide (TPR) repeat protein